MNGSTVESTSTVELPKRLEGNGFQDKGATEATAPAGDRPPTKTGAIRMLLRDGVSDAEVIKAQCAARWGYEVNSTDVGNARRAEREEKERKKAERAQRRQQKSEIPERTSPLPDVHDLVACQRVVDAMCLIHGVRAVADLVTLAESKAMIVLNGKVPEQAR